MAEHAFTALITGAGGFVGRRLAALAAERGWRIRAAVRDPGVMSAEGHAGEVVAFDLAASTETWRPALKGADAVVHAAARAHVLKETEADPRAAFHAANVDATKRLAEAAAGEGVRRFVFVSSIGVNGNTSGSGAFSETSGEGPVTPYAESKTQAEAELRSVAQRTGLEVVIVRPPLVYGPNVKANFHKLLQLVDKAAPMPFGLVRNRRSLIYVDNLADLLLQATLHPAAAGEVFVAADDTLLSTPELWRELARRMDRPARLLPVPVGLMRVAAGLLGKAHLYEQLCESLVVDAEKARRLLNWQPAISATEALDATVGWYRRAHREKPH